MVINSGNANACTGERGLRDAAEMARAAAATCGAKAEQALVLSTGIIGEFLPMDKIAAGITARAPRNSAADDDALVAAARGMLTTDTVHKLAGRELKLGGRTIQITGMAKGAAMIGPNMATMLGAGADRRAVTAADPHSAMLSAVVDDTFNCISVDGHMSTNDTVLLLANGAAGGARLAGTDLKRFTRAFLEVAPSWPARFPPTAKGPRT